MLVDILTVYGEGGKAIVFTQVCALCALCAAVCSGVSGGAGARVKGYL